MDYDANGNLTKVVPPMQPDHLFDYNEVDVQTQSHPPLLSTIPQPQTEYVWNLDKQLKEIIRPDGQTVLLNYDGTKGQLESISWPNGTRTVSDAHDGRERYFNLIIVRWSCRKRGVEVFKHVDSGLTPSFQNFTCQNFTWECDVLKVLLRPVLGRI